MSKISHSYEGKRILFSTDVDFDDVVRNLRSQTNPQGRPESQPPKLPKPHAEMAVDDFISYWEPRAGASGFTYFAEFDYGDWIRLFDVGEGRKLKRFVVGNPMIAITMIKHDLNASLFAPVELLVKQRERGMGTEVSYNLPSSQMLVGVCADNVELRKAAQHLDAKLESLAMDICAGAHDEAKLI